jgi:cbb3-type cytochrome oxidase maturation protein
MMPTGLWVVVGWMLFMMAISIVALIWGYKNHQFDDIEEAKYRMLEDKEPQPWGKGD